ncbi:MAG: transglycosylase SLT domain-containing protein [Chitinispirillaceae bacterium]
MTVTVLSFLLITMSMSIGLKADTTETFSSFIQKQRIQNAQYWQSEKKKFYRYAFETQNKSTQSKQEFQSWQSRQKFAIKAFEDSMLRIWGHYVQPTPSRWVEFSPDGYSVAQVDYKAKKVTVEATGRSDESAKEMRSRLKKAISRIITSKGFGTLVPVAGKDSLHTIMKSPILFPILTDSIGRHLISQNQIDRFSSEKVSKADTISSVVNGKVQKVFRVEFGIATESDYHMMKPFLPIVEKYARRYDLDVSLILATMHAESNFNPMARSRSNAIGLMQLVPDGGALDAYKYLYGKDRIPTVAALLDPETNIHLGCVYLFLLHRYHFGKIKDSLSVTYCSIAGYNTGPGNVAKAFSGTFHLPKAIIAINKMQGADKVFDFLTVNLPYRETRIYLQKVVSFMPYYSSKQLAQLQKK